MIQRNGKNLVAMAHFNRDGAKKVIRTIHKAMADGTLRLIWQGGLFLVVTPKLVWATEHEQFLDVHSNVNWTIDL